MATDQSAINIHSGGTLANCVIRNADDGDVIVFHESVGAWENEPSIDLNVAVQSSGSGLFVSGNGTSGTPLLFNPIQSSGTGLFTGGVGTTGSPLNFHVFTLSNDDWNGGTVGPTNTLVGSGTVASPLHLLWPFSADGDMLWWSSSAGLSSLSTGGTGSAGKILTVQSNGEPNWSVPISESLNGFVFPDSGSATVTVNPSTWTSLSGNNGSQAFPYNLGGLFTNNTLLVTIPSNGIYSIKASVFINTVTGAVIGTPIASIGFTINGVTPNNSYAISSNYISASSGYHLQVTYERAFHATDSIQLQVFQTGGTTCQMSCDWMQANKV